MQRRTPVVIGTMLFAILLGSGAIYAGQDATVNIDNFSFTPAEITVALGTKVTWTNRDDIPHTVTDASEPRAFKSPPTPATHTPTCSRRRGSITTSARCIPTCKGLLW
jgi:plastocyanin